MEKMSSLRQDPLTGRWVLLAEDRGKRPNDFPLLARPVSDPADCPFCPGHEDRTPKEVLATGRPANAANDGPGWKIRVFPNKYPAVDSGASNAMEDESSQELFREIPGNGRHEVIVYSPNHGDGPATLNKEHLLELLLVVRNRYRFLSTIEGVKYVLPFWNHGPEAGATLAHPHLQIIASPLVPSLVLEKANRQAEYLKINGQCLLCHMRQQESLRNERMIHCGRHFTSLAPWASRLPYEMMVLPNTHQSRFQETTDEQLADLAETLAESLGGLLAVHSDPPLNIIIHEAPLANYGSAGYGSSDADPFHWHLEILPRLSRMAGFEAGTGFTINSISAEHAARVIRGEVS
jgi:UDPglucose--hexose-1-phosphate uridylyltransferase